MPIYMLDICAKFRRNPFTEVGERTDGQTTRKKRCFSPTIVGGGIKIKAGCETFPPLLKPKSAANCQLVGSVPREKSQGSSEIPLESSGLCLVIRL